MHQNFIDIISPLTNKIVKHIDFSKELLSADTKLIKKKVPEKELKAGVFSLFDKITMSHYLECYLSSSKMDCMFFLRLTDSNDADDLYKVIDNQFKI